MDEQHLAIVIRAALTHTTLTPQETDDTTTTHYLRGINTAPRDPAKRDTLTHLYMVDVLADILRDTGSQWRYNTRAARDEIKLPADAPPPLADLPHSEWIPATAGVLEALTEWAEGRYLWKPSGRSKPLAINNTRVTGAAVLLSAYRHTQVDPFLADYLDHLPTLTEAEYTHHLSTGLWDWVSACFDVYTDCSEDNIPLAEWVSRYLPDVAVTRAYHPGSKADVLPIFTGPEGIGKSTILALLLPPTYRDEWHSENLRFGSRDNNKFLTEQMQGRVVCELPELDGMRQSDLGTLKAFLSRQKDDIRLAYRRDPVPLPRRLALAGTTNERQFLPYDPRGGRRFVIVDVASRHASLTRQIKTLTAHMDEHRDLLWQLSLYRHRAGLAVTDIPDELRPLAHRAALAHQYTDPAAAEAIDTAKAEADRLGLPYLKLPHKLPQGTSRLAAQMLRAEGYTPRSGRPSAGADSIYGWWPDPPSE